MSGKSMYSGKIHTTKFDKSITRTHFYTMDCQISQERKGTKVHDCTHDGQFDFMFIL